MSVNAGNLQGTLGMDASGFISGLTTASGSLNAFKATAAKVGAALTSLMTNPVVLAAAAVAALIAVGKAAFDMSEVVNTAYDKIRVGTGATGEALDGLKENFNNVFSNFPAEADDVAIAIADLNTRLGITGEVLEDLSTQFLELSRVTETDLSTNIEKCSKVFNSWNLEVEDYEGTLDMLFKVSQNTGIAVDKLADSLATNGASLRTMGFDLMESAAMLGQFEKEGVNASSMMSAMKIGLATMGEGTEDANGKLILAKDASVVYADALKQIKKASTDIEAINIAKGLFGAKAGSEMAAAIREGKMEYQDLLKTIEESPETIEEANRATMGFAERVQVLGNKITVAMTPLGSGIEVGLDKAFQGLNGFADEVLPLIVQFISFVSIQFNKIREVVEKVFGRIAETFAKYWEDGEDATGAAVTNIGDIISNLFDKIAEGIDWFFDTVFPAIEAGIAYIVDLVKMFSAIFAGDWDTAFQHAAKIALGGMKVIYSIMEKGWNGIMDGIEFVCQGIVDFIFDTINGVLDTISAGINNIIGMINTVLLASNKFLGTDFDAIGKVSWQLETPDIPQLTRFADSGIGNGMQNLMGAYEKVANGEIKITQIFNGDNVSARDVAVGAKEGLQKSANSVF